MPEPLKNMYNEESLRKVALDIASVYSGFQAEEFLRATINETWKVLELKDRITQIAENLGKYLPEDFEAAIRTILKNSIHSQAVSVIAVVSYGKRRCLECTHGNKYSKP